VNRPRTAALATLAAAALLAAGCAHHPPVVYAPQAYGETGYCYYVDSPAEAIALQAAGLCPSAWAPALMPVYWHAMYAGYYDSPAYYGAYVPVGNRTTYVTNVNVFERSHVSDIAAQRNSGRYKGTDGKQYTGSQVRGTNGGGSRASGGGGSRSSGSSGTVRSATGSGSRSSSGRSSSGGGGSRSTGGRR
jgi:hypothetical protein